MNQKPKLGEMPAEKPDVEIFPILDKNWPSDGLGSVAAIVAQLPDPAELRKGALVVVRESGPPRQGVRRWLAAVTGLFAKPPKAHPAIRCTAMLARGYREISSAPNRRTGEEMVWGTAAAP